jgi:hypothetical protein
MQKKKKKKKKVFIKILEATHHRKVGLLGHSQAAINWKLFNYELGIIESLQIYETFYENPFRIK